jgi:hypothetical protein
VMLLMLKALSLKDEGLGSILNRVSVLFAWVDVCIQIAVIDRLNLIQIIIRGFFWFVANIASNDFGVKRGETINLLLAQRSMLCKSLSFLIWERIQRPQVWVSLGGYWITLGALAVIQIVIEYLGVSSTLHLKLAYNFICIAEYLVVKRLILLVRMIQTSEVELFRAHPKIINNSLILGTTS